MHRPPVENLESRQLMDGKILSPLPDVIVTSGAPKQTISLSNRYTDTQSEGSIVDMNFAGIGTVRVGLLDRTTPLTVANFLRYVDARRYDNTMIHRSVANFVIQGGGYTAALPPVKVASFGNVKNEYNRSNLRGTIAMAKLGGDPNSATSEWFFNLADNSANLNNQNGGFTVFANVMGTGMRTVDAIAAIPRYDAGSPFDEIPLRNLTGSQIQLSNLVTLSTVRRVSLPMLPPTNGAPAILGLSVSSSNTSLVTATLDGPRIKLNYLPGKTGTANITLRVIGNNGVAVSDVFAVRVNPVPAVVTGSVFNDANNNRTRNTGETGLSNWRVFIDLDRDGVRDTNEPSALTDASGNFRIANLTPGSYILRVTPATGFTVTVGQAQPITLTAGATLSNRLIGARRV
jgi:cyclophilin family peptidyl-prolyl cis-trans isomerase